VFGSLGNIYQKKMSNKKIRQGIWFERLMAIAATVNLGLVLFNLSYISWRDFYLHNLPQITKLYDPIKGIEAHRDTENYLKAVDDLQTQISQTGIKSTQTTAKLAELRRLSTEIVQGNPFAAAGKSGTLEKIKNRMRRETGKKSSTEAFATFWTPEFLFRRGTQEINFFNTQIKPLFITNYYRHIGENGEFLDEFWLIDLPFVILFAGELITRSWLIKRKQRLTWGEAILWRWYDLLLLIPFWRWLRVIPVLIRLDQAQLLNLEIIQYQIERSIIANLSEEISEIVVIRMINQLQIAIKSGELTNWLSQKPALRPYLDVNNVNEIEAIVGILVKTTVYQVLPKIQPDIVAILRHSIDNVLSQSPIYRNLLAVPGLGQIPNQLSLQLSTQLTANIYTAIVAAVEDPVGAKLSSQLAQHFSEALGTAVQKKQTLGEIQTLMSDLLEEVKINYVQRLSQENFEQLLTQTRQMRSQVN